MFPVDNGTDLKLAIEIDWKTKQMAVAFFHELPPEAQADIESEPAEMLEGKRMPRLEGEGLALAREIYERQYGTATDGGH